MQTAAWVILGVLALVALAVFICWAWTRSLQDIETLFNPLHNQDHDHA